MRVPDSNRLPNVKGLKGPLGCLTQARYGITWGPIGAAIACFTEATEYAKQRILFNRPIAATQAVQLKLADMARRITLAQLLSLQLGRLKDAGKMQPTQVDHPLLDLEVGDPEAHEPARGLVALEDHHLVAGAAQLLGGGQAVVEPTTATFL